MKSETYLLAIDDEEVNRAIIEEIFDEELELQCLSSGVSCLEAVAKRKPDVILLDVSMPDMSGLEVCKNLRDDPENKDIPIIFVSALVTAEDRLAGYEAGGDDYVTKPFDSTELKTKVQLATEQYAAKHELAESFTDAMNTAMTAMSNASELGLVVRFLQESFDCRAFEDLAHKALEYIAQYGVEGGVVMQHGEKYTGVFSDDVERPLEMNAVEQLRLKGRIFTHGNKIIINGKRASLVIRDIPVADEEKVGRFRDHFAILLDGIDARINGIEMEEKLLEKQQVLSAAIEMAQSEVLAIDEIHRGQQVGVVQELSDIGKNIEEAFMTLGLTEDQERSLLGVVANAEKNTEALYDKGVEIDQRFNRIIQHFKSVL